MRHLDLFSGIGGFALAARWAGWETVGFCEIDPWCQKVLRKHWPDVPIHGDVKELNGDTIGPVDIITGGYPCQPFSVASRGRRVAEDLWQEVVRVVSAVRPRFVVTENVPGHDFGHIERACRDLDAIRYRTEVYDLEVPMRRHLRRRIYTIAYTDSDSEPRCALDAQVARLCETARQWRNKPKPVGVDDGVPRRVDRLRGLGNAIVPQVAHVIFEAINADIRTPD